MRRQGRMGPGNSGHPDGTPDSIPGHGCLRNVHLAVVPRLSMLVPTCGTLFICTRFMGSTSILFTPFAAVFTLLAVCAHILLCRRRSPGKSAGISAALLMAWGAVSLVCWIYFSTWGRPPQADHWDWPGFYTAAGAVLLIDVLSLVYLGYAAMAASVGVGRMIARVIRRIIRTFSR